MDVVVHHVELSLWNGVPVFVSTIEMPRRINDPPLAEGELPLAEIRVTPTELFESLAVEYDIDPDAPGGWDELLEIWAYAYRLGESSEEQLADPDFLINAPTGAHARKARLRKIRKFRGAGRLRGLPGRSERRLLLGDAQGLENSAEEDPIEFIRRTAPMSRPHMRVKAAHVHRERMKMRALRAGRQSAAQGVYEHEEGQAPRRDMRLYQRETPEELEAMLLGHPPVPPMPGFENREPPSFLSRGAGAPSDTGVYE